MTTIAIVASKGGAGKTTVAVHLAVAAMIAGERVAIVDLDLQQSALAWSTTRERDEPTVIAIDGPDLIAALDEARRDGYTVVVIDTAPRAAPVVAATVRAADFALVPMRPAAFDLATIEQIVAIIAATPTPGAIVLNACPSRAPEVAEAREVCTGHGVPLAPMQLGDRRAYARAVQTGRAVQEFEPRGAAAAEIPRSGRSSTKGLKMALKSFGTKPAATPPAVDAAVASVAPGPKRDDRVQKSVRLTKAQWRRVRQLEFDTERTFQELAVEGLSRLLAEHGLESL